MNTNQNLILNNMLSALSIAESLLEVRKAKLDNGGTDKVVAINKVEFENSQILVKALSDAVNMAKKEDNKKSEKTSDLSKQITIISTCRLTLNGESLQNKDVVKMPNNKDTKRAIELGLIKIIG